MAEHDRTRARRSCSACEVDAVTLGEAVGLAERRRRGHRRLLDRRRQRRQGRQAQGRPGAARLAARGRRAARRRPVGGVGEPAPRSAAARAGGGHRPVRARCSTWPTGDGYCGLPPRRHGPRSSTRVCDVDRRPVARRRDRRQPGRLLRPTTRPPRSPPRSRRAAPDMLFLGMTHAEEGDLPRARTATGSGCRSCTASAAPSTCWPASPSGRPSAGSAGAWSGPTACSRSRDGCGAATWSPTPRSSVLLARARRASAAGRLVPAHNRLRDHLRGDASWMRQFNGTRGRHRPRLHRPADRGRRWPPAASRSSASTSTRTTVEAVVTRRGARSSSPTSPSASAAPSRWAA